MLAKIHVIKDLNKNSKSLALLNKKVYHVVENHVIEIHVKQGTTVSHNSRFFS